MKGTVIWIGDLLIAMDTLGPGNSTTSRAIADLLGLARADASIVQAPPPEEVTPAVDVRDVTATAPAPSTSPVTVTDLPALAPREMPRMPLSTVAPLEFGEGGPAPVAPPIPLPLFSPLAERFITQELVLSSRFGPGQDVDRLVDALARCEIPQPLPLQENDTLARGVQVLIDDGEGMEPFSADQKGLVNVVRRLASDALTDVQIIHEIPDPAHPVDPWVPPPPRTPVLALTDLGLAGRIEREASGLVAAWQSAAATLAARDSALIALVPYPPQRWPASLSACMRLVHWDRSTTTVRARQARLSGPTA